ncbi:MAG: MFS transporter [Melioribacteraceae bacterium]|nr:MFS transporter [Melioribacteraceae bacterium]MCF8353618.1 MFS transporter [Melioribacteraceae bacterium]MCF8393541.1 MFS transporter [Melioribacteraceae bacterium]MCF8419351.1 MFS transporter [Melioribacteraceae bacterium]
MQQNKEFQTSNVILVSFAHFMHDVYSSFLAPLLPYLIEKFSLSYFLAGSLSVITRLPALFNPWVGIIADKISIRVLVAVLPAVTGIFMSLLGVVSHYSLLIIVLFFAGISSAFFHVPAPVMIREVSGTRIGKGMSFFMLGGELARSVGPIVILGAVSLWGLEGIYRLIPVSILVSVILFLRLRKIKAVKPVESDENVTRAWKLFVNLLPLFIAMAGITFFFSVMKASVTIYLPTYITSKGASIWIGGISLSIIQLAGSVGTSLSGTFSDKFGRKKMLILIAIISPVLMESFILTDGLISIGVLIILGLFLFAGTPIMLAMVQEASHERPSFLNGVFMAINFLMGSLAVMFIGFLGDKLGLDLTYQLCVILSLFSLLFILKFKENSKNINEGK